MKLHLTTATTPWREIALHAAPAASTPAAAPANPLRLAGPAAQTVTGFGGCFNEIGGRELLRLPEAAETAIASIEQGRTLDADRLPRPLRPLFDPSIQEFLISSFAIRPAELIARVACPVLILQGDNDLQIPVGDARILANAQARATLHVVPEANHLLKISPREVADNVATYRCPDLPLAPSVAPEIIRFINLYTTP